MIKGRNPYPFETIALAVSFAPGLSELVVEMRRLCTHHKAVAVFIHAGKKTGEKHRELAGLLMSNGFNDSNSRIYWELGETIPSILQVCKHEVVDLLITGASERANFALPIGRTAAGLATRAKCSVLILSNPPEERFEKIMVNGIDHKKTDYSIQTAIYFADKEKTKEITVIEDTVLSRIQEEGSRSDDDTKNVMVNPPIDQAKVKVNYLSLSGQHSSSVSEYAFKNNADLLVTNSSDHHLLIFERVSVDDGIDSLLRELPSNLLIVHSRFAD